MSECEILFTAVDQHRGRPEDATIR